MHLSPLDISSSCLRAEYNTNNSILVMSSTKEYMPMEDFKKFCLSLLGPIRTKGLKTLVFDKRSLRIFHQGSMVWYYTDWKDELYALGIRKIIKILPNDTTFQLSVKIGREKIENTYPEHKFHDINIRYVKSLEEALATVST